MKKIISSSKIMLLIALLAFTSCETDEITIPETPSVISETPTVISETTQNNNEATYTSIKISGKVTSDGGSQITSQGVCWSTNPNPTIDDNKTTETTAAFATTITNLIANTKYYFKVYAINNSGISYGAEQTFTTLNLNDTTWKFSTVYSSGFIIYSRVDFYDDNTTRFDELDYPLHCPGCFITFGTWSLSGNTVTYYFDSTDPNNPVYIYTGTLSGMSISGTYTHSSAGLGTWSAVPL